MMTCGGGLRHGSISASRRPRPQMVSALAGDDPRLRRPPEGRFQPPAPRRRAFVTPLREALSPFVLALDDSESSDADPPGTSLAVPDRLAGDQPDRPLHASPGSVRALPASPWPLRRAAPRLQRGVVGRGVRGLARRPRSSAPVRAGVRAARCDPDDAQACLSRDRAPQPRPDLQRPAMAEPRRALSALPHDPRRGRTSPAPLVERLPSPRSRRPLLRPIQLGNPGAPPRRGVDLRCRAS